MKGIARQLGLFLLYGLLGAILVIITGAVIFLESREDLSVWHKVELEEEYVAGGSVATFAEYLALEERLFAELEEKVVAGVEPGPQNQINRFARGSLSSPDRWVRNWNRSFEIVPEEPMAGALLLHGMSDSPYSMRALADRLLEQGVHVVGLRYPGHGTAPASLTRTTWEDMYGAVELAARYLDESLAGKPFYVFGYSTGGPLAVELSLRSFADERVPRPDGLVLFSPAMGITPLAALTPWQARLGRLLGFEKMAWNSIELEYDPFKYRSFPLNAAVQVWRLASHADERLDAAWAAGELEEMPPILSFQSVVDSTIEVGALLNVLYARLSPMPEAQPQHELVAYDFNRSTDIEPLLAADPRAQLELLLQDANRSYEFTVVANDNPESPSVRSRTGARGDLGERVCERNEVWPQGVYSMTHIAPPFPPDDPLYGGERARAKGAISLGNVVLRGEGSALRVSAAGFLRQTYNPFFDYQFERIADFTGLQTEPFCLPRSE